MANRIRILPPPQQPSEESLPSDLDPNNNPCEDFEGTPIPPTPKIKKFRKKMTKQQRRELAKRLAMGPESYRAASNQACPVRDLLPKIQRVMYHQPRIVHKRNSKLPPPMIRSKRPGVRICIEGCRYEIVRCVVLEMGMVDTLPDELWQIMWSDGTLSLEKALGLRRFRDPHQNLWRIPGQDAYQVTNHFPGTTEICRKDCLSRNLIRVSTFFVGEYDFFPMTWSLPADLSKLHTHAKQHPGMYYICKPEAASQGRGIYLTKKVHGFTPGTKSVCQVYLHEPFLLGGYKFDLRVYVLITSMDPLRVYVYNEGIVRFATVKYESPSEDNKHVHFMHLTNYSVNKFSQSYVTDTGPYSGSKRKLSHVFMQFAEMGYDALQAVRDMDDIIIKTIISSQPALAHYYKTTYPQYKRGSACFELLGFDVIFDKQLKPWLLEVNLSPSFGSDLPVDADVKISLLHDTFNIIHLGEEATEADRPKGFNKGVRIRSPAPTEIVRDLAGRELSSGLQAQFRYESKHCANYRLVYPTHGCEKYAHFFSQPLPHLLDTSPTLHPRVRATNKARAEREALLAMEEKYAGIYYPAKKDTSRLPPRPKWLEDLARPQRTYALPAKNSALAYDLRYKAHVSNCERRSRSRLERDHLTVTKVPGNSSAPPVKPREDRYRPKEPGPYSPITLGTWKPRVPLATDPKNKGSDSKDELTPLEQVVKTVSTRLRPHPSMESKLKPKAISAVDTKANGPWAMNTMHKTTPALLNKNKSSPAVETKFKGPTALYNTNKAPPVMYTTSKVPPAVHTTSKAPPAMYTTSKAHPAVHTTSKAPPAMYTTSKAHPAMDTHFREPPEVEATIKTLRARALLAKAQEAPDLTLDPDLAKDKPRIRLVRSRPPSPTHEEPKKKPANPADPNAEVRKESLRVAKLMAEARAEAKLKSKRGRTRSRPIII